MFNWNETYEIFYTIKQAALAVAKRPEWGTTHGKNERLIALQEIARLPFEMGMDLKDEATADAKKDLMRLAGIAEGYCEALIDAEVQNMIVDKPRS